MNYYKSFARVPDIFEALKAAGIDGSTALNVAAGLENNNKLYELELMTRNDSRGTDLLNSAMMRMINHLNRRLSC